MLEFSPVSDEISPSPMSEKSVTVTTTRSENADSFTPEAILSKSSSVDDLPSRKDVTFWGTFQSREFEYQFRCRQIPDDLAVFQTIGWIGIVGMLTFGQLDYQMFSNRIELVYLWTGRVIFTLFAILILLGVRGETDPKRFDRIARINMLALIALNVYVGVIWPSGHVEHKLSTVMIVLATYCIYPLPPGQQIALGIFHSVSDVIATICFNPPSHPEVIQGMVMGLILVNLMGIVTARKLHSRHRLLFLAHYRQAELSSQLSLALAEVKTLRGLIQLCAWCKQVHVEGGWQQIEEYIRANSHAEFTHGICPSCLSTSMKEVEG
jgi:hypothetical protein